ncbi:MAG: LPS export ABC transporter periplasmic protein LptC, partial [Beijerinckiaceae bacterium]
PSPQGMAWLNGNRVAITMAAATAPMMSGRHEQAAERSQRRAVAYGEALRHSRRVRFLKRAIPLTATIATVGVIVVAFFNPYRVVPATVSLESLGVSGSKITMDAPKLQGYKKDSRPYEVKASSAAQHIKTPHIIELNNLDANVAMGPDGSAHLTAPTGVFDSQKETLNLKSDVRVVTNTGYDIRMKSAQAEFKSGHVQTDQPVEVDMNDGRIRADGLEIIDNGKQIVFTGRVRTTLVERDPAETESPASPAPETKP